MIRPFLRPRTRPRVLFVTSALDAVGGIPSYSRAAIEALSERVWKSRCWGRRSRQNCGPMPRPDPRRSGSPPLRSQVPAIRSG